MGIKKLLLFFGGFFCFLQSFTQTQIQGHVVDSLNQPIPYANVMLQPEEGSHILAFTATNKNGNYQLNVNQEEGNYRLAFTALGYARKEIPVQLITTKLEVNAQLNEEALSLDEVVINAERDITVKKDTVIYKADSFKRGNEVVVEDLLKNLPGVEVDSDGTIKVGDREIERLMVDGDDLFEKGYKILSKNMTSDAIKEVEIYDKYSRNRLLKGIEESDRVAMNLVLKDDYKQQWFGNADIGLGGFDQVYQKTRINLMSFGKKSKYYLLANSNNIGHDAVGDIAQLIRPMRFNEPGSVGDGESLQTPMSIDMSPPQLSRARINFNDAKLLSLNAIHKLSDKVKIRTLGFFNWDDQSLFRNMTSSYTLPNDSFVNTEDYSINKDIFTGFAKLDFTYDISKTQQFEYTGSFNRKNLNSLSDLIFNEASTIERLTDKTKGIDQKFLYTNQLNKQEVLLFSARYLQEETPQNYFNNQFLFGDLIEVDDSANAIQQDIANQMHFFGTEVEYKNRRDSGNLLEAKAGLTYRKDEISNNFAILEGEENVLSVPNGFQNNLIYGVMDAYLQSSYLYNFSEKIKFTTTLQAHQLQNRLRLSDFSEQDQDFFYVQPSTNLHWEINNKNTIIGTYTYSTNNAEVLNLLDQNLLVGYRGFSQGIAEPTQLNASNYRLWYRLGNFGEKFFANFIVNYVQNHDFFSTNSRVEQNVNISERILIEDQTLFFVNSSIDRYIKSLSANLKFKLGYNQSNFENFVNDTGRREIESTNYTYGLEMRSGFLGKFNYHIGTEFRTFSVTTNQANFSDRNTNTDNFSFLDLSYMFTEHLNFSLVTERYYFGGLDSGNNTYYFSDLTGMYNTPNKKFRFTLSGKNLFNTRKFTNLSISDINTTATSFRLLPRIILLGVDFKF